MYQSEACSNPKATPNHERPKPRPEIDALVCPLLILIVFVACLAALVTEAHAARHTTSYKPENVVQVCDLLTDKQYHFAAPVTQTYTRADLAMSADGFQELVSTRLPLPQPYGRKLATLVRCREF